MVAMSDAQSEPLHRLVRAERRRRKLTQREVALQAGIGLRTYGQFELGQTTPQPENMKAILRAVGLDEQGDERDPGKETRDAWPLHVQVFLDTMGAFLMTMREPERLDFIHQETRRIFDSRRG